MPLSVAHRRPQNRPVQAQHRLRRAHVPPQPVQIHIRPERLLIRQVIERLQFHVTAPSDPGEACRRWLKRWGVPTLRRGRLLMVDSLDLEDAMQRQAVRQAWRKG